MGTCVQVKRWPQPFPTGDHKGTPPHSTQPSPLRIDDELFDNLTMYISQVLALGCRPLHSQFALTWFEMA